MSCKSGLEQNGLLCYDPCPSTHKGVGPVCWQKCTGSHPVDCGAICSKDTSACVEFIGEVVQGVASTILEAATQNYVSAAVEGAGLVLHFAKVRLCGTNESPTNELYNMMQADIENELKNY